MIGTYNCGVGEREREREREKGEYLKIFLLSSFKINKNKNK